MSLGTKTYDDLAREGKYALPGPAAHSSKELFEFFHPHGLVLDLGCGSGRHTAYMTSRGLDTVAFDTSAVQLARARADKKVCGDGARLPFQDAVFDAVLCSEVLEHLQKPELCIREMHRVLKEGGVACYTTPCLNIPLPMLVKVYRRLAGVRLEAGEHMHVFSASELRSMMSPLFGTIDVKYTKFTTLLQYRLRMGYGLDRVLSRVAKTLPPLRYLAGAVFIRVMKGAR